jgi:hypothetical protein
MITGVLSGFLAAFLNAVAFLFSARFLKKYNSSRHLLVSAHIVMLCLCLPAALCLRTVPKIGGQCFQCFAPAFPKLAVYGRETGL